MKTQTKHTPENALEYYEKLKAKKRLEASAPELLEALALAQATIKRLCKTQAQIDSCLGTNEVIKQAIAKAEGK